jgi:hypothetical protein
LDTDVRYLLISPSSFEKFFRWTKNDLFGVKIKGKQSEVFSEWFSSIVVLKVSMSLNIKKFKLI